MKRINKLIIFLGLTIALTACSGKVNKQASTETEQITETRDIPAETESEEVSEEQELDESSDDVEIEDMNGRIVKIPKPENIEKVYYLNPAGQIMIYTINPQLMAGLNHELKENELKYLKEAKDLEVLGTYGHADADVNPETFIDAGVQVFFYTNLGKLDEENANKADELQKDINVPVVVLDTSFENRSDTYRFLGKILGEEERANELAQYTESAFKEITDVSLNIPDEEKVSIYYAEGPEGLATEPEKSFHAAVFKYAGANNVADVELTPVKGMTPVSLEQILNWNPQYIFMRSGKKSPYNVIMTDPGWSNIDAVKNNNVYEVPSLPNSWIDRPPSSQQSLGIKYVAKILYPEKFNYDLVEETQSFYKLFYNYEMSEEEAIEILGRVNE